MNTAIRSAFTDATLHDGAHQFGVSTTRSELLGDHQAYVYRAIGRGNRVVALRFTHESHRSAEWIDAEMTWVEFLASQGVPVARPLPSVNGRWTEKVGRDGDFVASCLCWANGRPPHLGELTPELFETLGSVLGRMHRVTRAFVPAPAASTRPHWFELDSYDVRAYVPRSQERFHEAAEAILAEVRGLEHTREVYGLIHSDLHLGNVYIDGVTVTCFDFDSCQYHWLGYDIASVLFFTARRLRAPADELPGVLSAILRGYAGEDDRRRLLLNRLDLFLAVRAIAKYILYYKQGRVDTATGERVARIEACRSDIEHGRPFLGIEWNRPY